MKVKKSYGLILARRHATKGIQMILIKKPTTYNFCDFVAGKYSKQDDEHLKKLFSGMTYHEKLDIINYNFAVMWYRIYKSKPEHAFINGNNSTNAKQFIKKKQKFEATFLQDSGVRLRSLVSNTSTADTLWEIPKGRKSNSVAEEPLTTAIREFTEETGIPTCNYSIFPRIKPYVETYTDFGITYQNYYYYAIADNEFEPKLTFSNGQQIAEIADIRWCGLSDLPSLFYNNNHLQRTQKMFKKIISKIKNNANFI